MTSSSGSWIDLWIDGDTLLGNPVSGNLLLALSTFLCLLTASRLPCRSPSTSTWMTLDKPVGISKISRRSIPDPLSLLVNPWRHASLFGSRSCFETGLSSSGYVHIHSAQGVYKESLCTSTPRLNTSNTTAGRTVVETFRPSLLSLRHSIPSRRSQGHQICDPCRIRGSDCGGTATCPHHQHWHPPWSAAGLSYAPTVQRAREVVGPVWPPYDNGADGLRPRDGPNLSRVSAWIKHTRRTGTYEQTSPQC